MSRYYASLFSRKKCSSSAEIYFQKWCAEKNSNIFKNFFINTAKLSNISVKTENIRNLWKVSETFESRLKLRHIKKITSYAKLNF